MALQLSTTARTGAVTAIATAIYAAGGTPSMVIYSGTEPANAAAALSGSTVLASGNLAATASAEFSEAAGAMSIVSNLVLTGQSGAGTGTPGTFFRVLDSASACHMQGTVGATGSGADLILPTTTIATGMTVTITSDTVTEGGA